MITYVYFNPKSSIVVNVERLEVFLLILEPDNDVHYHNYYLTLFWSTNQFN